MPPEKGSRLARLNNASEYYTDEDMQGLGEKLFPSNVDYIVPAITAVASQLMEAIENFKTIQQSNRQ